MDFKKKLILRLYIMIAYVIIGASLCALSLFGVTDSDYVFSWGIALFICGIVKIIQYVLLMKNPEKMQKLAIIVKDERNIMLWEKARSLAFAVYIVAAGIAAVVLFSLNLNLAGLVVAYSICGFLAIYWICYLLVKRNY